MQYTLVDQNVRFVKYTNLMLVLLYGYSGHHHSLLLSLKHIYPFFRHYLYMCLKNCLINVLHNRDRQDYLNNKKKLTLVQSRRQHTHTHTRTHGYTITHKTASSTLTSLLMPVDMSAYFFLGHYIFRRRQILSSVQQ